MSDAFAPLTDTFHPQPLPWWTRHLVGAGTLEPTVEGVRLGLEGAHAGEYSDSQLDDFHGRTRAAFAWQPPVELALRARFSHGQGALRGTAGFGWWNAPFEGDKASYGKVGPRVLWFFFGSSPSNLAAAPGWSGDGWFAQGLNVPTLPAWVVRLGMLALRLPGVARVAHRAAGGASRATEQPLHDIDLTLWHEYRIEWRRTRARFWVDGVLVLDNLTPPPGPLALVVWMDNQWATLQGGGGLLDTPACQWMELAELRVVSGG